MGRNEFLLSVIGKPWVSGAEGPAAYDCYGLVRHTQKQVFGREMALIEICNESWQSIINMIENHEERKHWQVTDEPRDGDIVFMAATAHPAHLGVLFLPERRVLHSDKPTVTFDDINTLRLQRWRHLRYFTHV